MKAQAVEPRLDAAPFKRLLLDACGFCLENEREAALVSALHRRMAATNAANQKAYLARLLSDKAELERLVELLTVNETYFMREPDQLRLVAGTIVPEILREAKGGPVRILSAGCSTGEEPYSLAMLLFDGLGPGFGHLCQVSGVDIDESVLASARRGVYGKSSFRGLNAAVIERFFTPFCQGGLRIMEELRQSVRFDAVNLFAASYPALMRNQDVIFYRNVSIYFPENVQREVFGNLAGCLRDGGYLVVGAAETLPHDIGLLTLVERESLFVYRKVPGAGLAERRRFARSQAPLGPGLTRRPAAKTAPARPGIRSEVGSAKAEPAPEPAPRELFDTALALAREQKSEQALAILDGVLGREPSFVKAHTLKASIFMSLQRTAPAREECLLALSLDPLCLEAKLMLGMAALGEDDAEQALRYCREAVYIDQSCWLAHFYLGEIMFAKGERKRAKGAYETAQHVLDRGTPEEHGAQFFPLSFNAAQFSAICHHKLALLRHAG